MCVRARLNVCVYVCLCVRVCVGSSVDKCVNREEECEAGQQPEASVGLMSAVVGVFYRG